MISTLLFDFSRVLLFPKDKTYSGKLNDLYREIRKKPDYKFFDFFILNQELINFIKALKNKYLLAIFTTDIIQDDPAVKKYIDPIISRVFRAKQLGYSKKDPHAYRIILGILKADPADILFVDDTKGNLEAAEKAGFITLHFVSNQSLFKDLKKILNQ